ncbi:MAG: hypothetical protein ACK5XE_10555 [Burkholderiales bacterium]
MTRMNETNISAEIEAESRAVAGEYIPVSPSKLNLSSPEYIRREMARVYREARGNKIDAADATKLIYMLTQIAKAYELGVIEQRLQTLENQRGNRK